MSKLTKRIVDALQHDPQRDVFLWDTELRGFGVRAKPSGTKTFLIQYRNAERRTRRFVIGQYGVLTVELARDLAKKRLATVVDGGDPSADRRAAREGMTVAEVCDWYLAEAEAGRLLGRNRRPIKASSVAGDRSRIEQHIRPLIGSRVVSHLRLADIERLQADIAAGKTARSRRPGRGGRTSGGAGAAARAISTLRSLLNHAHRLGLIEHSPANGVRVIASHTAAHLRQHRRFTGVQRADDLGLLGHAPRGVTQRYVHLDTVLVIAADQVSAEIARLLDGGQVMSVQEAKLLRTKTLMQVPI